MNSRLALAAIFSLLPCITWGAMISTKIPQKDAADGCYIISSAEELYGFAALVTGGSYGPNGSYVSMLDGCGKLTADITVNEHVLETADGVSNVNENGEYIGQEYMNEWVPMRQFYGKFYGQGHVIRGLYVNKPSQQDVGFIGQVSGQGGTKIDTMIVDGLGIEDSYFRGKNRVAPIVGYLAASSKTMLVSITNSYTNAYVKGGNYVGGMVGYLMGVASLNVENSYSVSVLNGSNSTGAVFGVADICNLNGYTAQLTFDNVFYAQKEGLAVGSLEKGSIDSGFVIPAEKIYAKTATEFANGSVAIDLRNYNQKHDDDLAVSSSIWGQDVAKSSYPDFSNSINATNIFSVTFMLGDSTIAVNYYKKGWSYDMPSFAVDGVEIFGWYTNGDLTGEKVIYFNSSDDGKIFYAKWMKKDAEGCFEISDVASLYDFANLVNGENGFPQKGNVCGKLTDNITVNENVLETAGVSNVSEDGSYSGAVDNLIPWIPIGKSGSKAFQGEFHGCGFKIRGLYFNDANAENIGLIGFVGNTKANILIDSVNVEDSYISAKNNVGGIVGYANRNITIAGSQFNGDVIGTGAMNIGGIVGKIDSQLVMTEISSRGVVKGKDYVGGLVGFVRGNAEVDNSESSSDVTGTGAQTGGLVGSAHGNLLVSNSHYTGNIVGVTYAGGLVGNAEKYDSDQNTRSLKVTESYCTGPVSGQVHVGGLVGRVTSYDDFLIVNSYSVGDVSGIGNGVGGLVGSFYKQATLINSYSMGNVTGGSQPGGLIGFVASGVTIDVENSFYLNTNERAASGATLNGATAASLEEFANGTVAVRLHDYVNADESINGKTWSQNIVPGEAVSADAYPLIEKNGKIVFPIYVNLNDENNQGAMVISYTYGEAYTFPKPNREHFYFKGWFTDAAFAEDSKIAGVAATDFGPLNIYAKWEAHKFDILVLVNDETMGSVEGNGTYEYGSKVTLKAIANAGYQFSNWSDDVSAAAERVVTVTGAKTFTANFVAESSSSQEVESSSSEEIVSSSSEEQEPSSSETPSSSDTVPDSSSDDISEQSSSSDEPEQSSSSDEPEQSSSSDEPEQSSSSEEPEQSSSSVIPSEVEDSSGSNGGKDAVVASAKLPQFSVSVTNRLIQVDGIVAGSRVSLLDMQGRMLSESVASASSFSINAPRAGACLLRVNGITKAIHVK